MDVTTLMILGCAVFGASCLQSATGIGYGVIAGPIFLVALDGLEAFQISTIHNFWISLILLPSLWRQWNYRMLRGLVFGSSFGIIVGFYLQSSVDVFFLKVAATLMLGFVLGVLICDMCRETLDCSTDKVMEVEIVSIGWLTGIMGGMLAMPGPLAATWMSVRGVSKKEVRATILAFFIFAYGANILLYAGAMGFSTTIIGLSFWMLGPLVAGVITGKKLGAILSEKAFRRVLLTVLVLTIFVLSADWGCLL
ncbi:MAG: sulfite exporter TauE/SafE family protein [Paracoccaceae bacterium]|nr:sulfite exporter TauE/SafE family protein [Paracoccaceae bacterium]